MTIITGVSHREKNKIQVSIINKKEQHGGSFLASNPIFDLFSSLNEKLSVTAILREKKKNKFRSRSEKKMITSSNLLSRQNASYCLHVFLFAKSNFWSQMRTFWSQRVALFTCNLLIVPNRFVTFCFSFKLGNKKVLGKTKDSVLEEGLIKRFVEVSRNIL